MFDVGNGFSDFGGGGDFGNYESYDVSPSFEITPSIDIASELMPDPVSMPVDSYAEGPTSGESTVLVALPEDGGAGYEPAAEPAVNITVDPAIADQARLMLAQLQDATTEDNAEQLAPAIAYWSNLAGSESPGLVESPETAAVTDFDPNADFEINDESPEMLAIGEQYLAIATNAAEQLQAMINGDVEVSADDVIAMQGAMAEAAYATAFGAAFAGESDQAQSAAALALSYIDSLAASGVDVSGYADLVTDMQNLQSGAMTLSYIDAPQGVVELGGITFPSIDGDGGMVTFSQEDLETAFKIFGDGGYGAPSTPPAETPPPTPDSFTPSVFDSGSDDGTGYDARFADQGSDFGEGNWDSGYAIDAW